MTLLRGSLIKPFRNYGSEWMYFPDGDGVPRYINLSPPKGNNLSLRVKRDVEFRLYTKENISSYVVLNDRLLKDDPDIKKHIICNAPIKVITHGWMSTADKNAVMDIVNAYLHTRNNLTVISVDWSSYATNYFYPSVVNDLKEVSERVAQFLNSLSDQLNITGDQIHLIGHSLGAHIMGIAGFESKLKIGRITGLDPALPMFKSIQKEKGRLDYGDASFVDVIHTCGGVLGFWDAIGNADFYPNSGEAPQPGCLGANVFQFEACSHGRSIIYFAESIVNSKAFPSYQCNEWTAKYEQNCNFVGFMGESANPEMSGIFYLQTNSHEPFGRGGGNEKK